MRLAIITALILCVTTVGLSQQAVRTEDASGLALYRATAGNDTVAAAKFVSRIIFADYVDTDTIKIYSGVGSATLKAYFIIGTSSPAYPTSVELGFRVDSLLVTHTGTSKYTVIYRQGW